VLPLTPYERFWVDWFGLEGREVGAPYRSFCPGREGFLRFVDRCQATRAPCYLSVNPYRDRDRVAGLEKLFFDFDCADDPGRAFAEAADFARQLETHYRVAPLLVFSGRKGYHVYAYLWNTVTFDVERESFAKAVYRRVANLLLDGLTYETLDRQSLGDVKRLARVPYTTHPGSGQQCHPVDPSGNRLPPMAINVAAYQRQGLDDVVFETAVAQVQRRERRRQWVRTPRVERVRPKVLVLIEQGPSGKGHHHENLVILFELINAGYPDAEIHAVFQRIFGERYDAGTTQYNIDYARRRGYRPFRLENI
jgi:hypothetical protein